MPPRDLILEAKSLVRKVLGIPDPWKLFRDFEKRIHPRTWSEQPAVLDWLARVAPAPGPPDRPAVNLDAPDPLVRRFAASWADLDRRFRNRHAEGGWRVLIHLPPFVVAPATDSLLRNLAKGLAFCGVPVAFWEHWDGGEPLPAKLAEFRPNVLMSINHRWYGPEPAVGRDSLEAIRDYRRDRQLILGLSSPHFLSDPPALARELDDARAIGANFFYPYQTESFVREQFRQHFDRGFGVLGLEFGANPLEFHPLPGIPRDLDFVYLASSNYEKVDRVAAYLARPFHNHPGIILGPGWPRTTAHRVPDHHLRYLYARARIGLNLHVPFQVANSTELNERAYNLAACGTPQLMDNPALLPERFGPDCVYAADDPDEYYRLFRHMLDHPAEAAEKAASALDRVLDGHTVFHRADRLIEFVKDLDRMGRG